jgi:hypothetical protein
VLSHPATIPLSSRTLNHLADRFAASFATCHAMRRMAAGDDPVVAARR